MTTGQLCPAQRPPGRAGMPVPAQAAPRRTWPREARVRWRADAFSLAVQEVLPVRLRRTWLRRRRRVGRPQRIEDLVEHRLRAPVAAVGDADPPGQRRVCRV